MKKNLKISKSRVFYMLILMPFLFGCVKNESKIAGNSNSHLNKGSLDYPKTREITEIAVEPPPFTDGIFPCNDCHSEIEPNPVRRELVDFHDDISSSMKHDNENRWCLDCHDVNYRDSLRLASGKLLDFKESYKLCGQCHGEKLRDWKVGVHGKRTSEWNGHKEYLLCVHCHNPHAPKFQELTPDPPPISQEDIK